MLNGISIHPAGTYPVNLYGTVIAPWLYALRRQIWTGDRAVTEYSLERVARNRNPNEGVCYLFRGGFKVSPVCELSCIEVPKVKVLHMRGVISSYMAAGGAARNLTFIPGKVVCDRSMRDYDMLYVSAHDTFMETKDLLALNTSIKNHFPEFSLDCMDQYPKVDVMAVQKGTGDPYAEVLNASVLWSAVTFSHVYIEVGKDIHMESLNKEA